MNERVKGWANERRSGWLREGMREPQGEVPEGDVLSELANVQTGG